MVGGPEILARGFTALDQETFGEVRERAAKALDDMLAEGVSEPAAMRRTLRRVVWASRWLTPPASRPMLVPVIVEV